MIVRINQAAMADYHFGGSEEENAELRKLELELVSLRNAPRNHSTAVTYLSYSGG